MSEAPYLIIEKAFWKCPVSIFGGLSFFVVGLVVGRLLSVL
jgi:hypothetical protein